METITLTGEERLVLERLHLLEQNTDHHQGPLGHVVQPQEIALPGLPAGHLLNRLRRKLLVERTRNSGVPVPGVPPRLFLVLNPTTGEGMSALTRSLLEIWASDDNGKTWGAWQRLESDPGEHSYPAIVHDPEANELLVTYTFNKHSIRLRTIPGI